MLYQLINNEKEKRFEIHIDNKIAFEDYKLFEGGISFMHTEIPKELAGKGIGSLLAKSILDYAATHHLKVKPFCPFIKKYIDRHPEYQENSMFHNKYL